MGSALAATTTGDEQTLSNTWVFLSNQMTHNLVAMRDESCEGGALKPPWQPSATSPVGCPSSELTCVCVRQRWTLTSIGTHELHSPSAADAKLPAKECGTVGQSHRVTTIIHEPPGERVRQAQAPVGAPHPEKEEKLCDGWVEGVPWECDTRL